MSKSTGRSTVVFLVIVLIALPLAALGFIWLLTLPDVNVLAKHNPTSTALMDFRRTMAKEQGRPFRPQWMWVPLSRISPHLRRAVLTAEDAAFFSHEGFDWEGIKDAVLHDLETGSMRRGGSTITQQVAKNLYLSSERSLLRKAREALITRSLEHALPKSRILEIYLNIAEWGRDIYGAEAAARHHFGKSAKDLTVEDAALLAAILPSPRRYDPLQRTRFLSNRQQHILRWMDKVHLDDAGQPSAR
ncbi:MAG: monofunctional biosynthetic peptidoglycan transglycosylase [Nitrospiraceae bacterium]